MNWPHWMYLRILFVWLKPPLSNFDNLQTQIQFVKGRKPKCSCCLKTIVSSMSFRRNVCKPIICSMESGCFLTDCFILKPQIVQFSNDLNRLTRPTTQFNHVSDQLDTMGICCVFCKGVWCKLGVLFFSPFTSYLKPVKLGIK